MEPETTVGDVSRSSTSMENSSSVLKLLQDCLFKASYAMVFYLFTLIFERKLEESRRVDK